MSGACGDAPCVPAHKDKSMVSSCSPTSSMRIEAVVAKVERAVCRRLRRTILRSRRVILKGLTAVTGRLKRLRGTRAGLPALRKLLADKMTPEGNPPRYEEVPSARTRRPLDSPRTQVELLPAAFPGGRNIGLQFDEGEPGTFKDPATSATTTRPRHRAGGAAYRWASPSLQTTSTRNLGRYERLRKHSRKRASAELLGNKISARLQLPLRCAHGWGPHLRRRDRVLGVRSREEGAAAAFQAAIPASYGPCKAKTHHDQQHGGNRGLPYAAGRENHQTVGEAFLNTWAKPNNAATKVFSVSGMSSVPATTRSSWPDVRETPEMDGRPANGRNAQGL